MALLWRQIRTLTYKNLRITLWRHWLSTPLRALFLPILIVLLLSFTQNFLSRDSVYGLGHTSRPIRALSSVKSATTDGRDRVIFVNSGFVNGTIDKVIADVAAPLRESGINIVTLERQEELSTACTSNVQGTSHCIAGVVFYSSPTEGNGSIWNYTIRADGALSKEVFVDADNNDAQVYVMPIQHEIDWSIARHTSSANQSSLPLTISEYPFTSKSEDQRQRDNRVRFMNMITNILAAPIYLALACVVYHMTGFIATEREIGMARLLETMMPNRSRRQPQVARVVSYHLAFDFLYGPGWIATGAILGARCFPRTSVIIPMVFHVVAGLSTTSLAAFSGIFFRKAQLSGIITIIAALLLAVIAQLSAKAGTGFVVVLSLIFPPMNYVYFLDLLARWESEDKPLNFFKTGPKTNKSSFAIPAVVFFIFALYQTFVYPIMGALIEQRFYESTSAGRRTVISQSEVAVNLNGFTKEYTPGWMVRALCFWTKRPMESVIAVDNLTLQAWRGEILVLLGANGSGKSTTLDAVAGLRSISSGEISINYHHPHEGFGHCPQSNIFWDDLTVREHIQIFDGIKSNGKTASQNDIKSLIKSCDLTKKSADLAKSLSGGQKRKLQMAMMFAGGSTVCCVDEVSSGVDPLSRRKLWDILLAERGRRSIILTTHFLDEADLLADRIAILSNGLLKASGTSVELKHRLGSGYRVHMHHVRGASKPPVYSDILYTEEDHETIYFPSNSTDTHHFLQRLEYDGVKNYEVKGPTLEDVFFKIEGKTLAASAQRSSFDSGSPLVGDNAKKSELLSDLGNAKRVGMAKQITTLGAKRFMIFQRNPIPYIAALLIVLIAAGCSTLFLKADSIGGCDPTTAISSSYGDQNDLGSKLKLVVGPEAQLTQAAMEKIAAAPPGAVTKANSLDEFNAAVQRRYLELIPGAFFLGDQPTIAWQADATPGYAFITQNLVNSLLFNITIESTYGVLEMPFVVDLSGQLLFIAYFGLSMAVYPAFLSLYPTMERLCGVRAMHYSNGVRALPLWLAYLLFDSSFIVSMSSISVIIFVATSDVWYAMGYLFLIFLLYGISSTLYSYVISLFSKSQLAAFAITAATQAAFFVVYFVIFMVVFTYTEGSRQTSTLNIAYFTLATASPVVSLARALYLTVNVFGISCRDKKYASYPGAIDLYGGPILYLVLQSLVFFGILFWKESGSTLQLWRKRKAAGPGKDSIELEAPVEFASATKASDGLRVMSLRKEFKKHLAVDNITFGIPRSECFALVGPNGAGKSTTISMIRGDAHPTGHDSEIFIEGVSAIQHRSKARSRLGVCPQIDPLDTLTVSEHLQFYAKIRGISDPLQNTEMIMKAVGLEPFANRIATRLSGGNKRKLSLGIAMVGNPSVIVLDEPSSGMDALSKRIMWRTLSSITPGRSLLLTTHSMEEADALATRAGIVASRMLAFGTTEELRSRYGNAYFVNLVHSHAPHTSAAEMHSMERWVKYEFPEATLDGWMGYGQVKFEVPLRGSSGHSSLADIFGKLEEAKTGLDVQYYSVSMATLDQVFLDVVGRHVAMQEE